MPDFGRSRGTLTRLVTTAPCSWAALIDRRGSFELRIHSHVARAVVSRSASKLGRGRREEHDSVVPLRVVQHLAVEGKRTFSWMIDALHRGRPCPDFSSFPVVRELGAACRERVEQGTKMVIVRVDTQCFAKLGSGHSCQLLCPVAPEDLAESRRREG